MATFFPASFSWINTSLLRNRGFSSSRCYRSALLTISFHLFNFKLRFSSILYWSISWLSHASFLDKARLRLRHLQVTHAPLRYIPNVDCEIVLSDLSSFAELFVILFRTYRVMMPPALFQPEMLDIGWYVWVYLLFNFGRWWYFMVIFWFDAGLPCF